MVLQETGTFTQGNGAQFALPGARWGSPLSSFLLLLRAPVACQLLARFGLVILDEDVA
jgi:hypothetical protein